MTIKWLIILIAELLYTFLLAWLIVREVNKASHTNRLPAWWKLKLFIFVVIMPALLNLYGAGWDLRSFIGGWASGLIIIVPSTVGLVATGLAPILVTLIYEARNNEERIKALIEREGRYANH